MLKLKRLLLIFVVIFFSLNIYSQNVKSEFDSLRNVCMSYYDKNGDDTTAIKLFKELYFLSVKQEPYFAFEFAAQAMQIAKNLKDSSKIASMHNLIGDFHLKNKTYYLAMDSYIKAYDIYLELRDDYNLACTLLKIGNTYYKQDVVKIAKDYYNKALTKYKSLESDVGIAEVYKNYGILSFIEDEELSLDYYNKAINILENLDNQKNRLANLHLLKSKSYLSMYEIEDALNELKIALDIFISTNSKYDEARTYYNYGLLYLEEENYEKAKFYFHKALLIFENFKIRDETSIVCNNIGEILIAQENYEKAYDYAIRALSIEHKYNFFEYKLDSYQILFLSFKGRGDLNKALKYSEYSIAVSDTLILKSKQQKFSELQTTLETQKQQREIETREKQYELDRISAENEKNKLYNLIAIISVIFLIIFSLLLYFRYREKSKSNNLLSESNTKMLKEIEERKLAQEKLKNSEERYRLIFRKTPTGIMQYDNNYTVTNANDKFATIFRLNRRSVIGKNLKEIFSKEFFPEFTNFINKNNNSESKLEKVISTDDGDFSISLSAKHFFYTENGKVLTGGIVIVEENTKKEVKQLSENTITSKTPLILEMIPDMVFLLDENLKYIDAHVISKPNIIEKYKNKHILEALPEQTAKKLINTIKIAQESQEIQYTQYPLIMDEVLKQYEARIVPGKNAYTLFIVRDITLTKEDEENNIQVIKAETTQMSESETLSNISISIKPNLEDIVNLTSQLQNELIESPEYFDYIEGILDSCQKMIDIFINFVEFSDFSKISKIHEIKHNINKSIHTKTSGKLSKSAYKQIKRKLNPLYENVNQRLSFNMIKNFGEQVILIGEQVEYEDLILYGKELTEIANTFDIPKIKSKLNEYKSFYEQANEV